MATAAVHYDAKAAALAGKPCERTELQRFHNDAKRALLAAYAAGAESVLDLACGRGGDVHKWLSLGIAHVKGLDVSPASVAEARSRFAARKSNKKYEFHVADLTGAWTDGETYDVVSCMFALHYFFGSEEAANRLMRTVSAHLRPGGHFVGIVPDAQRIVECINPADPHLAPDGQFDNGAMRVRALWTGKPRAFGSAYRCQVQGTVTEGSAVDEFLVYGSVLETLAARHGLVAERLSHPCFVAGSGALHCLAPPYGGAQGRCTSAFAAFAFRKTF
jgi:mRNA (guanine-N7-)-methyltransferase